MPGTWDSPFFPLLNADNRNQTLVVVVVAAFSYMAIIWRPVLMMTLICNVMCSRQELERGPALEADATLMRVLEYEGDLALGRARVHNL